MSDDEPEVDPDQMDIMVATDCHLGYEERDPVRGLDSFAAFEEVLLLAKAKKVDFVLLGEMSKQCNTSKHVM
jgi:double-strand break repair protein MRE11